MTETRSHRVFEMLVRQNDAMLITYIRAIVRDNAIADDLYQETMITAWKKFDDYDQSRPLGPWLRGIAKNLIRNANRKKTSDLLVFGDAIQEFIEHAVGTIDKQAGDCWDDRIAGLRFCVKSLPDAAKQLVSLRYEHGNTATQIAAQQETTAASIRKRLQRVRESLLKCLRGRMPELEATIR